MFVQKMHTFNIDEIDTSSIKQMWKIVRLSIRFTTTTVFNESVVMALYRNFFLQKTLLLNSKLHKKS